MSKEDGYEKIGNILKAHGIKGELRIKFDLELKASGKKPDAFFISHAGKPIPYFIEELDGSGQHFLLKLESVNDRTKAEMLRNKELLVERENVSKFFKPDVKNFEGYTVIDKINGELGIIDQVNEMPNQFIASLIFKGKEILLPLNESTIAKVEKRKKIIHVVLPDGLLDIYQD